MFIPALKLLIEKIMSGGLHTAIALFDIGLPMMGAIFALILTYILLLKLDLKQRYG